MTEADKNSKLTAKQAYKVMFAYLDTYWQENGKPEAIGDLLSQLALWETESGSMEPMDASIFPECFKQIDLVIAKEQEGSRSEVADIHLNGKKPTTKVRR
ncbi:MAG: hypothetical protein KTR32_09260 [Granulosicoccus sp.]|nr:hypothetical protein [Granulosicoccus sp.]